MYYHQISEEQWPSLKTYLDTCVLPVAAIHAGLEVWEIKEKASALEEAEKWMERSFSGRVIIYPEVSYMESMECFSTYIKEVIHVIREKGFRYIVLLCNISPKPIEIETVAVIQLNGQVISEEDEKSMRQTVLQMWESGRGSEPWMVESKPATLN
jgi:hypothetical protein